MLGNYQLAYTVLQANAFLLYFKLRASFNLFCAEITKNHREQNFQSHIRIHLLVAGRMYPQIPI